MKTKAHRFTELAENRVRMFLVIGIVFVVFNVLVFVPPFKMDTPTFWIAYVFTLIAIVAQAGVCILAFGRAQTLRSKVLGFPIFETGLVYLVVQVVLCFILLIAGSFIELDFSVSLIPCVLILAAAAVIIIAVDAGREEITRQDESIRADTSFIRLLTADIQSLIPRATDDTTKIALNKLYEALRYSDPVHTTGLEGVEAEIGQAFVTVKSQVVAGNDASKSIEELSLLLNERNLKARVLKQQAL
jgi:hypothetical protein